MAPLRQRSIWLAVSSALCAHAQAQIVTDGTLGAVQSFNGQHAMIPASLGRQVGGNLFHSFGAFNVPTNGSATFTGPAPGSPQVSNVISRVTGGQASLVDGLLRSNIANANLFLINPRGIVFGPGASLDLTGSFFASTANYLKLADGTRFEAVPTVNPILTAAAPAAFGFLGPTGPVNVRQGALQLATPGRSLSLVGGPVNVSGAALDTAAGGLHLVGTAGAGEVTLAGTPTPGMALAPVMIQRSGLVAGSALDDFGRVMPPGRIVIRGGELKIADSVVFSNSFSNSDATAIELTGSGNVELSGTTQINAFAQRAGRGAAIVVRGENVTFAGGALVQSLSNPGAAGDIDVAARDTLRIVAGPTDPRLTTLLVETQGPGQGGAIRLSGDTIGIEAALVSNRTRRSGRGGSILLEGRDVRLVDGAFVTTETSPGSTGAGGSVQVRGTARFLASGQDWDGNPWLLGARTGGAGNGGSVSLQAPDVHLSGGIVATLSSAGGNTGAITIDAETVRLETGSPLPYVATVTSSADGGGDAGPVTVRASRSLSLDGVGFNALINDFGMTQLNAETLGAGRVGNVVVESPLIVLDHGARIAAESWGGGDNGSVLIRTHDLTLRGQAELRSIRGDGGSGRSGSVRIDGSGRLTLGTLLPPGASFETAQAAADNRGSIFTTDFGLSVTGDIIINMAEVHVGAGSELATASGRGSSGAVTINAQRMKLTAGNISTDMFSNDANAPVGLGGGAIVLNIGESLEMSQLVPMPQLALGVGGLITSLTTGSSPGGSIVLSAPYILLDEAVLQAAAASTGRAGNIAVRANDLIMRNGAQIVTGTETTATGGSGSIEIDVSGRFEMRGVRRLDGVQAGLSASTRGSGGASNISVRAGSLLLDERAFISSSNEGGDSGGAGSIDVRARTVDLANGATIRARSLGSGAAGSIHIEAGEALRVFNESTVNTQATSSEGGNITLAAPRITVESGGQVVASASGAGNAGQIQVRAGELLRVDAGAIASETTGSGSGGRISLSAPRIELTGGARVAATSAGSGEAGRIDIRATDALRLFGSSAITTEARSSDGGNIDIRVGNLVHLKRSEISTAVGSGAGAGGNVFIDPTFVILEDGSRIVANAFGGPGGNIQIFATYFLNTLDSLVDASSAAGVPGTVSINSPNSNLSTQIKVLPATVFDASALVREACSSRYASGKAASSLVGVGRGGLAASPERFAASTYFGSAPAAASSAVSSTGLRLVTAQRARLAADCAG